MKSGKSIWIKTALKVATTLNNPALFYRDWDRFGVAKSLYHHSIGIREGHFGKDHPGIAAMLCNLAGVLEAQGKFSEAVPVYRRALAINETNFGAEEPSSETLRFQWF